MRVHAVNMLGGQELQHWAELTICILELTICIPDSVWRS